VRAVQKESHKALHTFGVSYGCRNKDITDGVGRAAIGDVTPSTQL
jgi:hypothetical protein